MSEELKEECGLFGVFNHPEAVQLTYLGLHALQHRGQDNCGIFSSDGDKFYSHKGGGLVTETFDEENLKSLLGNRSIGHVRYATAGNHSLVNAQPLSFKYTHGQIALAHNGNLVNAFQIRESLVARGSIFQTESDTEVVSHLIAQSCQPIEKAVRTAMSQIEGAYALLFMTRDKLVAAMDPFGFRPLCIGRLGDAWFVSSESCGLDVVGAQMVREMQPGEIAVIDHSGLNVEQCLPVKQKALCSFEYIYFSRPDTDLNGLNVHVARKRLGMMLAEESHTEADVVIGVPDSGLSTALGYSEKAGIPYDKGLLRNRYVGRTFIQPTNAMRESAVKMKLSAVKQAIRGRNVILIDDSIVRGTTSARLIKIVREAGAKSVHMKISSPPISHSCYYGINTSKRKELIAVLKTESEVCDHIGADSLHFLTPEGMLKALAGDEAQASTGLCTSCFNGNYLTNIYENNL